VDLNSSFLFISNSISFSESDRFLAKNLATFLMADGCEYLTGQTIAIDGAQYLSGGGTFSQLSKMSDDDWAEIRDMIKKTNDSDKQKRTT
jgi:hypothetical protein